jgi:hypothetical protein
MPLNETPNPKSQIPRKRQTTERQMRPRVSIELTNAHFAFFCIYLFPWDLGFGIWSFAFANLRLEMTKEKGIGSHHEVE